MTITTSESNDAICVDFKCYKTVTYLLNNNDSFTLLDVPLTVHMALQQNVY